MLVSDFDFHLPDRLIAQEPAGRRDSSRLLVVDRTTSSLADSTFNNLSSYLAVDAQDHPLFLRWGPGADLRSSSLTGYDFLTGYNSLTGYKNN